MHRELSSKTILKEEIGMEKILRVARPEEIPLRSLPDGSARRILCHDAHMMAVEVHFPKGVQAALHHHPHSQISYVLSGSFRYVIDGEETVLAAGESIVVPPDAPHCCAALEAGVLLDVFTPAREDFLQA